MILKTCKTCLLQKSANEFPQTSKGYIQPNCLVCYRTYMREWHRRNPEKSRAIKERHKERHALSNRLRKYSLSKEQFQQMKDAQGNLCAICLEEPPTPKRRSDPWNVDHCPTTGRVRGLLCNRCNQTLGKVKDSTEILQSMIGYLDRANDYRNLQEELLPPKREQ